MKTAVIYARYSCDNQSEQSIEGQLRVCEEYAQRNNILILDTYIDRAMTGTNDNRPDFRRMIKDSDKKSFNYVLVYKLDRFSRNKYETAIHKKTLRDNGVKVLSAMENIPDTPEGIILESLLEGMNQYYSAELSQKVRRGMRETRLKGLWQGGHIIYGYKIENKKILIDEDRAEIVRYIFNEYAKGVYVKDIIKILTQKGIYNHGKPFARNTIYNLLKNEKYSGICRHNGEVFKNMYPQIISQEIFNKVRAKIQTNKYGKRSVKAVYLLRHKVKCGYCGQPMNGESGTAKSGVKFYYYKCNGRKKHINDCNKSIIRKDVIEDIVINTTIQKLSNPEIINYIVSELLKIQERQLKENAILAVLTKQYKQVESALNNLVSAVERGIVSKTTNKRLQELERQQEQLERQILIERSKQAVQLKESNIKEFYTQMLQSEPKILINFFIKQIKLFDDKIVIEYNSPIKLSPDSESWRGFSIYSETIEMVTYTRGKNTSYTQKIKLELFISR